MSFEPGKDIALSVERLSKSYSIARNAAMHTTMAEALTARLRNPLAKTERETFWALRDVSFDVGRGEVLGVIGRNGAGKSTLLKMLSRITEPTEGEIKLYGRVGSLLEVGTGFHPELTGRENIFLNGAILGMTRGEINRQFDSIVAFAEVEKFLDTPVKRYSSGMYVRLAFAVAAHLSPEILIVDEVLAVGDADFQKKCLGKMGDISQADGTTVLFVSHNMAAVKALTRKCAYLRQGRLVSYGPTDKVLEEYLVGQQLIGGQDLTEIPRHRTGLAEKAKLIAIRASAASDEGFLLEQPLGFDITVFSALPLSDARIGLTICDAFGAPIMTTASPPQIHLLPDAMQNVCLRVRDTRLAPGRYSMDISIYRGGIDTARVVYDVVKQALHFDVQSIGANHEVAYEWMSAYGTIRHPDALVELEAVTAK